MTDIIDVCMYVYAGVCRERGGRCQNVSSN